MANKELEEVMKEEDFLKFEKAFPAMEKLLSNSENMVSFKKIALKHGLFTKLANNVKLYGDAVLTIWQSLVQRLGSYQLISSSMINAISRVIQSAMAVRDNIPLRIKTVECWRTLIDACLSTDGNIDSAKVIRISLNFLQFSHGNDSQLIKAKLNLWWHLIVKTPGNFDKVALPFLEFAYKLNPLPAGLLELLGDVLFELIRDEEIDCGLPLSMEKLTFFACPKISDFARHLPVFVESIIFVIKRLDRKQPESANVVLCPIIRLVTSRFKTAVPSIDTIISRNMFKQILELLDVILETDLPAIQLSYLTGLGELPVDILCSPQLVMSLRLFGSPALSVLTSIFSSPKFLNSHMATYSETEKLSEWFKPFYLAGLQDGTRKREFIMAFTRLLANADVHRSEAMCLLWVIILVDMFVSGESVPLTVVDPAADISAQCEDFVSRNQPHLAEVPDLVDALWPYLQKGVSDEFKSFSSRICTAICPDVQKDLRSHVIPESEAAAITDSSAVAVEKFDDQDRTTESPVSTTPRKRTVRGIAAKRNSLLKEIEDTKDHVPNDPYAFPNDSVGKGVPKEDNIVKPVSIRKSSRKRIPKKTFPELRLETSTSKKKEKLTIDKQKPVVNEPDQLDCYVVEETQQHEVASSTDKLISTSCEVVLEQMPEELIEETFRIATARDMLDTLSDSCAALNDEPSFTKLRDSELIDITNSPDHDDHSSSLEEESSDISPTTGSILKKTDLFQRLFHSEQKKVSFGKVDTKEIPRSVGSKRNLTTSRKPRKENSHVRLPPKRLRFSSLSPTSRSAKILSKAVLHKASEKALIVHKELTESGDIAVVETQAAMEEMDEFLPDVDNRSTVDDHDEKDADVHLISDGPNVPLEDSTEKQITLDHIGADVGSFEFETTEDAMENLDKSPNVDSIFSEVHQQDLPVQDSGLSENPQEANNDSPASEKSSERSFMFSDIQKEGSPTASDDISSENASTLANDSNQEDSMCCTATPIYDEPMVANSQPLCADARDCNLPVDLIAGQLVDRTCQKGFTSALKEKGINTVGDLAVLTETDIAGLPVKADSIRSVIETFMSTVESTQEPQCDVNWHTVFMSLFQNRSAAEVIAIQKTFETCFNQKICQLLKLENE